MLDGLQTEQGYSPESTESTRPVKPMLFNGQSSLCDNSVYHFIGHNIMRPVRSTRPTSGV